MSSDDQMIDDQSNAAYNRLRRLQEHARSNIPAMIANRAASTFTLHNEPPPIEATTHVLVTVYPQDPFVGEPEVRTMNQRDIQPGLTNSRVRVQDKRTQPVKPDADGNYLFWPGEPFFDQVNAFYYTTFTLRMYERYAQRALPWSFPAPRITIDPSVGSSGNAFYSEQDQMIGFHEVVLHGERFNTSWSADIVSHEAAHAVLDGLRDLYNESFGLGPSAFHESFCDISAMLVALHDDSLVRRLLEITKGNLQTGNFVAEMAEHLIHTLNGSEFSNLRDKTIYLRNAINKLKLIPFAELPLRANNPEYELSRQPHNYSRVFTGAFYDIMVGIYDYLRYDSHNHIAIYRARDIAAGLLVTAVELGPVGEFSFADMAKAFLAAEMIQYSGRFNEILVTVFADRHVLSRDAATSYLQELRQIPEIRLPESINSAMASALFLEEKILPLIKVLEGNSLIPLAAYRNAAGSAYLTYFTSQRITIHYEGFNAGGTATVDLFGGLTLMFDPGNRLRCVFYRPVTEADIEQAQVMIQDLLKEGQIVQQPMPDAGLRKLPGGLLIRNALHFMGRRDGVGGEHPHLIRYPIISDQVMEDTPDLVDYLKDMANQMHNTAE